MFSEGPGAVYEEPKVCEPIFKGPGSVLKGLIPVLGDGPNKAGFEDTSEGPKPEDLRSVSQGPN